MSNSNLYFIVIEGKVIELNCTSDKLTYIRVSLEQAGFDFWIL